MKKSIFILAAAALVSFTSCKDNASDKVNGENVAATTPKIESCLQHLLVEIC